MTTTSYARALWRRHEFTAYLALARIQARNASTSLGLLWWVLNPLLLAGIYYLMFGVVFNARNNVADYFFFLISGIFAFYYTRGALLSATSTILANARLMVNLSFPRMALVLAGVMEAAFGFASALLAYLIIAVAAGRPPGVEAMALPLIIAVHTMLNIGMASISARLTIPYRDLHNLLPFALRLWLYMSPIVYTMDQLPGQLRSLILLNPLTPILELYRWSLVGQPVEAWVPLAAIGWAVLFLAGGTLIFVRAERHFVRYL